MQARYDLINKLFRIKSEMEVLIKNIVSYKSSKGFNQKMNHLISEFDIALKQVPKSIVFHQDQKPVALQEFLINFQKKVNYRKENLLNRYIREIEQIKSQFNSTAKQSTAKSIEFIEDTQHFEQRFKRQLNVRKHMNKESLESLKKHQKSDLNTKEIEEEHNKIKNTEENRIIQRRKNELATLQLQIDHLRQELNEALTANDDDSIKKRIEFNNQKIEIMKNSKKDEIELIKKKIAVVQSDIQSNSERITNLQQSQIEMQNNFQTIIDHFDSQSKQQIRFRIKQMEDELQSLRSKISSLQNEMANPIVPLNKESFEFELKKELENRELRIKSEEKVKRIEWEEQILAKIDEYHAILKEISQLEYQTENHKEKVAEENKIRIEQIKKENQKEIDEINDELIKTRTNYLSLSKNDELIRLQIELFDVGLKMHQIENEKNEFENNKIIQKIKNKAEENKEIDTNEFYPISETFMQQEMNKINKVNLIINKLNGQLKEFQDEKENYINSFYQLLIEKTEQEGFECKTSKELNDKEICLTQINQNKENLFKIENESNNLFFSIDSLFEIIDEYNLKIDGNEEEDKKLKEHFKNTLIDLKQKQQVKMKKLHSVVDELNKQKNDFSLSLNDERLHDLKMQFIEKIKDEDENYIRYKNKEAELMGKAVNEINEFKQSYSNDIKENFEILKFIKKKEIEKFYLPIINTIKEQNQIDIELMKLKLQIAKRKMLIEEKEEELIYKLKNEIFNLEKHFKEIENPQPNRMNRKVPLPPLKDI